jgi:hypothetical protein
VILFFILFSFDFKKKLLILKKKGRERERKDDSIHKTRKLKKLTYGEFVSKIER